jgi:hypothetical protein
MRLFFAAILVGGMCALLPIAAEACSYGGLSRLKSFDEFGTVMTATKGEDAAQ